MKTTVALLAFLIIAPGTALAQPPSRDASAGQGGARLQLGSLDKLASQAAEVVNISIDPDMLKLAGAFIKGDGDQAAVKSLVSGLKGIYVRSYEFDREMTFASELEAITKQLAASGWTRLVTVDSKRDRENVGIYSWREGDASGGLAIVVAEPMELTVVNIVGPIDLAKLPLLQGQFGIPRLPDSATPPAR